MGIKQSIKKNQFVVNYKRMWRYVQPIWGRAILSLLICIPLGAMDSLIAIFLKPYTDIVVVGKSMVTPWYIPTLIVAFTTVQGLLNYGADLLSTWVGGKMTMAMKDDLYAKLLTRDAAYFDTETSGTIQTRYNKDAELACSGLLENLKNFVTRIFSSLALIIVLFWNSWHLALMAIVVLAVAVAPLTKVRKLLHSIVREDNLTNIALMTNYNETYAGNKTIFVYNLEDYQKAKFRRILRNIFALKMGIVTRTSWISPFMHFVISIGLAFAVLFGTWLITSGTITPGNFVAFLTALLMLYTPLKKMNKTVVSVQQSFLAIERIYAVFDSESAVKEKAGARELAGIRDEIRLNDVSFEYVQERPVLKNVSLSVKAGETIALVGNSGGGKTTIASLLPRFYDVKSGSITIDGTDIRDLTLHSLRENIAVVFQDNFLFAGTIRENIMMGRLDADEGALAKAVENAYLTDFINTLPKGLDTEIGERGVMLSGGQKQRVAIARAFLKDAPIIVLDEATSALDNQSEEIVQQAIDNLMKDKTVIVIAHRLSTIRNANRIAVMHEGELAELGTHNELMSIEDGIYKHLYEMQFKESE
ncbi:MAG: ATP-binding cassette domain-containing protein [Mailhella sp.]|nr:ATP-binding cassette domain-containing protein [Mailhella sp.]